MALVLLLFFWQDHNSIYSCRPSLINGSFPLSSSTSSDVHYVVTFSFFWPKHVVMNLNPANRFSAQNLMSDKSLKLMCSLSCCHIDFCYNVWSLYQIQGLSTIKAPLFWYISDHSWVLQHYHSFSVSTAALSHRCPPGTLIILLWAHYGELLTILCLLYIS